MKIFTVVGARPQFIKAATVSRAIRRKREAGENLTEILVHTGQHFDRNMSTVFFDELNIPRPDHNLGITHATHGGMTGRMLERLDELICAERPRWVLVYGDTNSTLAGALAAVKLQIPVAHVEAGLRSFNRRMPEEINRVLTDRVSELLLAPSETAMANLADEGVPRTQCHLVGDVMYDAALYYGEMANANNTVLNQLGLEPAGYYLATIHRAENTDDPSRLSALFNALFELTDAPVVLPLHPRTKSALHKADLLSAAKRQLRVIEPVGYIDMIQLERNARLILTDSGGIQKEAFFHRIPCITLRDETEWLELVDLGWNRLVPPTEASSLREQIDDMMRTPLVPAMPYGTGNAAERIVELLCTGSF